MSADDSASRDSAGTSSDNGTQVVRPERTMLLQNWLSDHSKNPYPTKGEKIMLSIMSKMTIIEVSTWFANARRRLRKKKKCNCAKMKRI